MGSKGTIFLLFNRNHALSCFIFVKDIVEIREIILLNIRSNIGVDFILTKNLIIIINQRNNCLSVIVFGSFLSHSDWIILTGKIRVN